jgi:hypothetical protein
MFYLYLQKGADFLYSTDLILLGYIILLARGTISRQSPQRGSFMTRTVLTGCDIYVHTFASERVGHQTMSTMLFQPCLSYRQCKSGLERFEVPAVSHLAKLI